MYIIYICIYIPLLGTNHQGYRLHPECPSAGICAKCAALTSEAAHR